MTGKPITGRKVFIMFAGFFGGLVVVNAVFIWLAVASFPGLETEGPYSKGLDYDRQLEAAADQRALGWTAAFDWRASGDGAGRLVIGFRGKQGRPVTGLDVNVLMRRPVRDGADVRGAMMEGNSGSYESSFNLPASGNWDAVVEARGPDGVAFRIRKRLVVP